MSVTATSLSDSLPSSIPKLDPSGLNWAIFSVRFKDAVEAKGFCSHFEGTDSRPAAISITVTAADDTVTTTPPSAAELAAVEQWDKCKGNPAITRDTTTLAEEIRSQSIGGRQNT